MRWTIFLKLGLCALLALQPAVLVRNLGGLAARTVGSQAPVRGQIPEEEEEKLHGVRSAVQLTLRVGFRAQREVPPVPVRLARGRSSGLAPRSCEAAVAHWRAALLPPRSSLEDPPIARA